MYFSLNQNEPDVLALIDGGNPFRDSPPKYIRATLYHYHYTRTQDCKKTKKKW